MPHSEWQAIVGTIPTLDITHTINNNNICDHRETLDTMIADVPQPVHHGTVTPSSNKDSDTSPSSPATPASHNPAQGQPPRDRPYKNDKQPFHPAQPRTLPRIEPSPRETSAKQVTKGRPWQHSREQASGDMAQPSQSYSCKSTLPPSREEETLPPHGASTLVPCTCCHTSQNLILNRSLELPSSVSRVPNFGLDCSIARSPQATVLHKRSFAQPS